MYTQLVCFFTGGIRLFNVLVVSRQEEKRARFIQQKATKATNDACSRTSARCPTEGAVSPTGKVPAPGVARMTRHVHNAKGGR